VARGDVFSLWAGIIRVPDADALYSIAATERGRNLIETM